MFRKVLAFVLGLGVTGAQAATFSSAFAVGEIDLFAYGFDEFGDEQEIRLDILGRLSVSASASVGDVNQRASDREESIITLTNPADFGAEVSLSGFILAEAETEIDAGGQLDRYYLIVTPLFRWGEAMRSP